MAEPLESSGGDVDLDVLRLLLRTNAATLTERLASNQNQGAGAGGGEGSPIAAIAAATSLGTVLDDIIGFLVRQARDEGRSWAAIGYALQVSRQAAFQRFGSRTGERLETTGELLLADAAERGVRALGQFLNGDFDALRAAFNERMTEACPLGLLESVRFEDQNGAREALETGNTDNQLCARIQRRRDTDLLQKGRTQEPYRLRARWPHRRLFRDQS